MTTTPSTAQPTPAEPDVTGPLVAALHAVWGAIRQRHPDVPPVVITIGSGTAGERPGTTRLGHFAAARWEHADGDLAELFVAGEGLADGPTELLGTLLHEAAHGIAHTRGVQDTSRQGRYHNTRYKVIAMEVGLKVAKDEVSGWTDTSVPASTRTDYRAEIKRLDAAITAHRRSEHIARTLGTLGDAEAGDADGLPPDRGRASNNNGTAAHCGCGRRVRVAPSVLELGPIICGLCGTEFTAPDDD